MSKDKNNCLDSTTVRCGEFFSNEIATELTAFILIFLISFGADFLFEFTLKTDNWLAETMASSTVIAVVVIAISSLFRIVHYTCKNKNFEDPVVADLPATEDASQYIDAPQYIGAPQRAADPQVQIDAPEAGVINITPESAEDKTMFLKRLIISELFSGIFVWGASVAADAVIENTVTHKNIDQGSLISAAIVSGVRGSVRLFFAYGPTVIQKGYQCCKNCCGAEGENRHLISK